MICNPSATDALRTGTDDTRAQDGAPAEYAAALAPTATPAEPAHAGAARPLWVPLIAGRIALSLALAAASSPGQSQPVAAGQTRIGVGAAVLVDKDGYRGVGADTLLIPGVSVRNKWIDLFGPQLDLRLVGSEDRSWWAGPRIEYRFDGYERADGTVFNGMEDRKGGAFFGVAAATPIGGGFALEVDFVRAGRSERGAVGSVQISRAFQARAWTFVPRIGAEYQSARYVDYYYGVRANEATSTRPAYRGTSATSAEVGLFTRLGLSRHQSVFINLNYERYPSVIRSSPLMDASGIAQAVIGYQYNF